MNVTTPGNLPSDTPERRSRAESQRDEARKALANSYEHGAPETGPGEDLEIPPDETEGGPSTK